MSDLLVKEIATWIDNTHRWLRNATKDLTDEQIAQQPGREAPPIGWHIFHIARWADRLQASFQSESSRQGLIPETIWVQENQAQEWGLHPEELGWLETGSGMDVATAVIIAELGTEKLQNYMNRAVTAVEETVARLGDDNLRQTRRSIFPQLQWPLGEVWQVTADREQTIMSDFLFHISHVSRHLGMIEGLRGAMFSMAGTATV